MKIPNRSLDDIASKIHQVHRENIFETGALLIEARKQCDHGEWGAWLEGEFEWSQDTANNYMLAAELATKFRNFRNLKLTKSTVYALARQNESDLPTIIAELEKHALKHQPRAGEAEDIVAIGRARGRHGDHPDATLRALDDLGPWEAQAIERLKVENPTTDEAATTIIDAIADVASDDVSTGSEDGGDPDDEPDEIKEILDSPPPLPPPSTPPATPSLREEGELAVFQSDIEKLKRLMTKPAAKFKGAVPANDLILIAEFLIAIAEASETEKKPNGAGKERSDVRPSI
jgi:Protein of unknown function (DUF3102)